MTAKFRPTHRIVLSELSDSDREYYMSLLSSLDPKFHLENANDEVQAEPEGSGKGRRTDAASSARERVYVANCRLLAPGVTKTGRAQKEPGRKVQRMTMTPQERLAIRASQLSDFSGAVLCFRNIPRESGEVPIGRYQRFNQLFFRRNDPPKPKLRPINWIMRLVEDIYDVRFVHDQQDLAHEEDFDDPRAERLSNLFPVFVVDYFSKRYGLRNLVEQTCAELVANVELLRADFSEVEVFARFLEESYDADDLLFFLYVRSVLQKALNVSLRNRWNTDASRIQRDGPAQLFMRYRECVAVARAVYESETSTMSRNLLALLRQEVHGSRRSGSGSAQGDTRRINIERFLFLAVQCYHDGDAAVSPSFMGPDAAEAAVNKVRASIHHPGSSPAPVTPLGRRAQHGTSISLAAALGQTTGPMKGDMSTTPSVDISSLNAYLDGLRDVDGVAEGQREAEDAGVTLASLSLSDAPGEASAATVRASIRESVSRRPTRGAPPPPAGGSTPLKDPEEGGGPGLDRATTLDMAQAIGTVNSRMATGRGRSIHNAQLSDTPVDDVDD